MRKIVFNSEKGFRFAYEAVMFPKIEPNEQQERAQARLLDKFEAVGETTPLTGDINTLTFGEGVTELMLEVEDAEFRFLKAVITASRPNGLYVRTKLALLDYLDTVKEDEAKAA